MAAAAAPSAEHDREALLLAMARVVGRQGYSRASSGAAIEKASSCRAAFDRHFADKEECFLAAQELLAGRAVDAVAASLDTDRPWPERVCGALERATELCIANPEAARALLVEPAAAGAEGRRRALAMIERFAKLFAPEPELAEELPPRAALMAVSGVAGLIGDQLARGEAAGLATLMPDLIFTLLVPLLGPVAAGEKMAQVRLRSAGQGWDRGSRMSARLAPSS